MAGIQGWNGNFRMRGKFKFQFKIAVQNCTGEEFDLVGRVDEGLQSEGSEVFG